MTRQEYHHEAQQQHHVMHARSSLTPGPTSAESYGLHQPVANGLGLMDCSLPYPFQAVVGGAPASPAPSLPWSNSIPGPLPLQLATPEPCDGRASSSSSSSSSSAVAAYECLPAYHHHHAPPSPASSSIESAFPLMSTCMAPPEHSPSPNTSVSLSHRSSLSSGASRSGSGFVSPPETDHHPYQTHAAAVNTAGTPDWLVHQISDLSMVSMSQDAQARMMHALLPSSTSSSSPSNSVMAPAMDGSLPPHAQAYNQRSRRHTHEGVSYHDAVSPALSLSSSRTHDGARGTLSRIQFPVSGAAAAAAAAVVANQPTRRRRRQLTTKAEANHECEQCGKFFERRYNYRAHLATHDKDRVYAHVCPVEWCDKRFVRKTDLSRHNQSVHLKQRDYQCDMCGHLFARKDTLRRHTEDGCSKRFQLRPDMFQLSSSPSMNNNNNNNNSSSCRVSPCPMPSPAPSSSAGMPSTIDLSHHHHASDMLMAGGAGGAAAALSSTEGDSSCMTLLPTAANHPPPPSTIPSHHHHHGHHHVPSLTGAGTAVAYW